MKIIFNLLKNPLFSGSIIMIIGSNAYNALNYLFHLIVGRLLGPPSYGELASLISLGGLLGVIPATASLVIIKYISAARSEDEIAILISWFRRKTLQLSVLVFILLIILSPVIRSFLNISNIFYVSGLAISFLFYLPALLNRAILQGLLKFKELVVSILIENCIKLVGSIFLIYLGYRIGGVMIAIIVSAVFSLYITSYYLKVNSKNKLGVPSDIKAMMKYTFPVIVQSIALTSIYSSDLILVKHFFSPHDAGIYASLSTLGKIIFFGAGPIGAVMFPLVSQKRSKGARCNKEIFYSFLSTLILAIFVLLIYWLFPQFAINLLYGQSFLEAVPLLVWFGIFMTFFTLASLLVSFHLSLGNTKVVLLPAVAAIAQVTLIWFYHESLFSVIQISLMVSALLLAFLLIYSSYAKKTSGDQINFSNSSSI